MKKDDEEGVRNMKSEQEIREEIEAHKNCIINAQEANKNGLISEENLDLLIWENQITITSLKWVLGEDDRFN